MRAAVSVVFGCCLALALFLLMQSLISMPGDNIHDPRPTPSLDFIRIEPEVSIRQKQRFKPLPPPPQKAPPAPPPLPATARPAPELPKLAMRIPTPEPFTPGDSGLFLGVFEPRQPAAEGDVIPIVRIEPQYPREALIAGTTGWVKIEFTINEDGTVSDAEVVAAEPPRVFNRAALRAILRWKFKPRVVEGLATSRRASQVIEFQLEG